MVRKNCACWANPPLSFLFFCCEWVTSATFHFMWTNGQAQTNQQSTYLDVYGKWPYMN